MNYSLDKNKIVKRLKLSIPLHLPDYMKILLSILLITGLYTTGVQAQTHNTPTPVIAHNGMVASQHYLATQAGVEVLKEGGNAVDAAVTIGFTLAVTLPAAGNLGGGGFMVAHLADSGETIAINYREKAPGAAYRDMFLDGNGDHDTEKSEHSYWAVGVPGTVAGLTLALEKYGTISLARALQPAIDLAGNGFEVDESLHNSLKYAKKRMQISPASMAIFFKDDGAPYEVGEILVQKDLAWSLKQIRDNGPDAFYKGKIAEKIAADMSRHGGMITLDDLKVYKPSQRPPVHGTYRGYDIFSMPPPSSGGVHVIQMLNLLEAYPQGLYGHNTPKTIHLMAECMRLAFADRSKHLGDSDFVPVPVSGLISKRYADFLRDKINLEKATPSEEILPGNPAPFESDQTTHYSVMDRYGNAVSNTYTLNFSYGTGVTAAGTGILLNNEMDDFSAKPGSPNADGLLGGTFNAIEPHKRMLSSMTPTLVMKDGKVYLATGSPGSSRIINSVFQIIVNVIDHELNIAEAAGAPRFHHQWYPDRLRMEKGFDESVVNALKKMGHEIEPRTGVGVTQNVMRIGDTLYGASDPRSSSSLAAGY